MSREEKFNLNNWQFLEEYKVIREILWVFVIDDEIIRNKRIKHLREKVALSSLIQVQTLVFA